MFKLNNLAKMISMERDTFLSVTNFSMDFTLAVKIFLFIGGYPVMI